MTLATALFGAGVKSVQTGTILMSGVTSNTATISSVNTAKSVVLYGGCKDSLNTGTNLGLPGLELTNSTTVTATRSTASSVGTAYYTVLEFY